MLGEPTPIAATIIRAQPLTACGEMRVMPPVRALARASPSQHPIRTRCGGPPLVAEVAPDRREAARDTMDGLWEDQRPN